MREEPVPCLVMLAADCYIDAEMNEIVAKCKIQVIPYIFIPTKRAMRDALSVENDVYAVLIAFNHDPGMRREFEDCYVSITAQCFKKKKRRRDHGPRASTSASVPPEIGPRGEMPQQVSTEVATVPSGEEISTLEGHGSSDDWVTVSSDSESSDSDIERPQPSRDFSVNVPDESGSTFHEYVRIPSPTPAPSPSEMAAQQREEEPLSPVEESTTACSSDESLRPGPSRDFLTPPIKRRQHSPHRQASWPISLPYAPKENFDDEKIRMYLQTICGKKKMRLRSKTSVPSSSMNDPPGTQGYMQYPARPQPSTSRPCTAVSQASPQDPIDVDSDDLSFRWTMDDLPSAPSTEQLIDLTVSPNNDSGFVHELSSSEEDEIMVVGEPSTNLQNLGGAAGDGGIYARNVSTSSSSTSTATLDLTVGICPNSTKSADKLPEVPALHLESPRVCSQDESVENSARSSDTQTTSSSSSGEIINLCPSSSSLFEMSDTPSAVSNTANSISGLLDDLHTSGTSFELDVNEVQSGPSTSESSANVEAVASNSHGDVPAVPANIGELGDATSAPSVSRAAGVSDITRRLGSQHPSAFGDVGVGDVNLFPIQSTLRPPRIPHRVTGTGEGGPSPFMPTTMSFMFAPRVLYTAAAAEDGRRLPGQPREEDLLGIPFPMEEYGPRSVDVSPRNPDEEPNPLQRSHSMDVIPSDDEESELSSDEETVRPPSPFEFKEE